jgi:hypothetical protein
MAQTLPIWPVHTERRAARIAALIITRATFDSDVARRAVPRARNNVEGRSGVSEQPASVSVLLEVLLAARE